MLGTGQCDVSTLYNTFLENRDYILESVSKKITITSNRPKPKYKSFRVWSEQEVPSAPQSAKKNSK